MLTPNDSAADGDAGSGFESVDLSDVEGDDLGPNTSGHDERDNPPSPPETPDSPTTQSASLAPKGEVLTQLAILEDTTPRRPSKKENLAERMASLRAKRRGSQTKVQPQIQAQNAVAPVSKSSSAPQVIVDVDKQSPPKSKLKSQVGKSRKNATSQKSRQKLVSVPTRLFDPSEDESNDNVTTPKQSAPSPTANANLMSEGGNDFVVQPVLKRSSSFRSKTDTSTDDGALQKKTVSGLLEKVVALGNTTVQGHPSDGVNPISSAVILSVPEKSSAKNLGSAKSKKGNKAVPSVYESPAPVTKTNTVKGKRPLTKPSNRTRTTGSLPPRPKKPSGHISASEYADGEVTENESVSDKEASDTGGQELNGGDAGQHLSSKKSEAEGRKCNVESPLAAPEKSGNSSALNPAVSTSKTTAFKSPVSKTRVPKAPVPKNSVSKTLVSKTPVSKAPVSKAPVSKALVSKTQVSEVQAPVRDGKVKTGRAGKSSSTQKIIKKKRVQKGPRLKSAVSGKKSIGNVPSTPPVEPNTTISKSTQSPGIAVTELPLKERSKEMGLRADTDSLSVPHTQSSGSKSIDRLRGHMLSESVDPPPLFSKTAIESDQEGSNNVGAPKLSTAPKRKPNPDVERFEEKASASKSEKGLGGDYQGVGSISAEKTARRENREAKDTTGSPKRPARVRCKYPNNPDSGLARPQDGAFRNGTSSPGRDSSERNAALHTKPVQHDSKVVEVARNLNESNLDDASLLENADSQRVLDTADSAEFRDEVNEIQESPQRPARTYPTLVNVGSLKYDTKAIGSADRIESRAHDNSTRNEQSARSGEPGATSSAPNETNVANARDIQGSNDCSLGYDEANYPSKVMKRDRNSTAHALDSLHETGIIPQDNVRSDHSPSKHAGNEEVECTSQDEMDMVFTAVEHAPYLPTRAVKKAIPVRKPSSSIFDAYEHIGSLIDRAPLPTTGAIGKVGGVGRVSVADISSAENHNLIENGNDGTENLSGRAETRADPAPHNGTGFETKGENNQHERDSLFSKGPSDFVPERNVSKNDRHLGAELGPISTVNADTDTDSEDVSRVYENPVSIAELDSVPIGSPQVRTGGVSDGVTDSHGKNTRDAIGSPLIQSSCGNPVRDDKTNIPSSPLRSLSEECSNGTPNLRNDLSSKPVKKRGRDKRDSSDRPSGESKKARGLNTSKSKVKKTSRLGPTTRTKAREPRSPVTDKRNIIVIDDDDRSKTRTANDASHIGMNENIDTHVESGSEHEIADRGTCDTAESPTPQKFAAQRVGIPWHENSVELGLSAFRQMEQDLKNFLCKQDDEVQNLVKGLQLNAGCNGQKPETAGVPWRVPKSSRLEARVLAMKEVVQLRVWETFKEFATGVSRAIAEEAAPSLSLADAFVQAQPNLAPASSRIESFNFHHSNQFLDAGIRRRSSLPNPSRPKTTIHATRDATIGNSKTGANRGDNNDLLDRTDHDEEDEDDGNVLTTSNPNAREAIQSKQLSPDHQDLVRSVKPTGKMTSNLEDDDDTFYEKTGIRPMRTVGELKEYVGNSFHRLKLDCYRSASLLCLCAMPRGCTKSVLYQATPIGTKKLDSLIESLVERGLLYENRDGDSKVYKTPENIIRLR